MNTKRYCETGKQECPTPYNCQTGCYFNETEDKDLNAGRRFWDASPPGHYEQLDKPASWVGRIGDAALVAAVILFSLAVALFVIGGWL